MLLTNPHRRRTCFKPSCKLPNYTAARLHIPLIGEPGCLRDDDVDSSYEVITDEPDQHGVSSPSMSLRVCGSSSR